jgi:D-serine deaminase-like pyridoxal phosphate-dependent protein
VLPVLPVLPGRPTPALIVDLEVLDANITAMAAHARSHGLALRPHAKTHKSVQLARRQRAGGAAGLTVATLGEAEAFAAAGFDDLFIAYPLWVDAAKGHRLARLLESARVAVGLDSVEAARALAAGLPGRSGHDRLTVLVEVDRGHHRSGVAPQDAGALADLAAHSGLEVRGVFTFPGHSYSPGRRGDAARDEQRALKAAAASLTAHGVPAEVVSGGSTPSAAHATGGVLTELRPGVYVFGDAQQWELGSIAPEQIALCCLATVVSHGGGNLVLDSGSKALGADRASWATGNGRLLDHPDARIVQLSEHHAVVTWPEGTPLPEIGSRLRVVPNHVCNAVNLADELVVVRDGEVVDVWPVLARAANR